MTALSDKERAALRLLLEEPYPLTALVLARKLGVSERSVRTYVHRINERGEESGSGAPVTSTRRGYICDRAAARTLLTDARTSASRLVPQTSEERMHWLANRVLRASGPLDLYDLCEEVYVSISTMNGELARVRRQMARFDLALTLEDSRISVHGTEKNKRRMLSQMLYDETSVNFLDIETIQNAFPDIDAAYVHQCVVEVLAENRFFANDYSLINMVLHIAIALDRIKHAGAVGSTGPSGEDGLRPHEREMAAQIASLLESHFDLVFPTEEIDELALLLSSRTTLVWQGNGTREEVLHYADEAVVRLADSIIGDIEAYYYINLSEQEFFLRFVLHIKNLLTRARRDSFSRNPLTDEIRSSCPLLWDAAVDAAGVIKRETGFVIDDDEIAYIAFHLGSALETQRQLNRKVRAALYCPAYYNIDRGLSEFFEHHFKNDVLIAEVATTEEQLKRCRDVELVVTTSPIGMILEAPVVRIGIAPRERDVERIAEIVADIRRQRRRVSFRAHLEALVMPGLFVSNMSVPTRESAIALMVQALQEEGCVDAGYANEIWEREHLSSTVFGRVAVPHALRPHARKSRIAVLVPEHPIAWGGSEVDLILMLSFSLRERSTFNELFDPLVSILIEPENVERLVRAKDFVSFVDLLSEMVP